MLARAIADQGFAAAVRMLGYKTIWNGGRLILVGRWYPSSKTCSGCGAVKAKLALSERTYRCDACGLVADRDRRPATGGCGTTTLVLTLTDLQRLCITPLTRTYRAE